MKTNIEFKRYIRNGPLQCKEIEFYSSGTKHWYLNRLRHKEDGPAIENNMGYKEWWLEGEYFSEQKDYWKALKKYKRNKLRENQIK